MNIKEFFKMIIFTILTLCSFGGGCFFYLGLCLFFKIELICMVFVCCTFIPIPISLILINKYGDRLL